MQHLSFPQSHFMLLIEQSVCLAIDLGSVSNFLTFENFIVKYYKCLSLPKITVKCTLNSSEFYVMEKYFTTYLVKVFFFPEKNVYLRKYIFYKISMVSNLCCTHLLGQILACTKSYRDKGCLLS